ncbi:MAG: Luciferase-like monooxygenase YhbW [uncultured Gemmatimonadaceae bacterium]|uniref:Luciferase-like monooxygenase n=1 Tax=uncultured Gemmatimonadaceae bacterium TaxID=246130 RepID=A0A6J4LIP9_9BACT|nr:MAG: Luciferase-like monooxygenase YhbW [uncultured Gemmatimonadaceae bacterium]
MTPTLSVLDLVPVAQGSSAAAALRDTVALARHAERLGYVRYWFAEHHGMPGIASSAPELLIAHVAAATQRIRVGSGGIMLPNHAPLRVAEAFHTLEALHPGRIDLGLGRAPGTDPVTSRALHPFDAEQFPAQLDELLGLSRQALPAGHPSARVRVVPAGVTLPPVYLLGSSGASARLAGAHGLGYGFARHFSPTPPAPAIQAYRESFRPSAHFERPHVVVGAAVVCADTADEAAYHAASMELARVRLVRGQFGPVPGPDEALAYPYTPQEQAVVAGHRALSFTGTPDTVRASLHALAREVDADEIMVTTTVTDPAARRRSYELLADAFSLAPAAAAA